jgi:amino acid adenylation domain-containing protein
LTSINDLLSRLRSLDVRLTLDGDRLNVSAPKGALTEDLRAELSSRKEQIKALLREARAADQSESVPRVERAADMPVSHTQQRLWFMKQMDPSSAVYNVANAFTMEGRLDVRAFERALRDLVVRHEGLRTRFITVDGAPRCVTEPDPAMHLEHVDVSHLPPGQGEQEADKIVQAVARRPFRLERAPLMHLVLVRVRADLHYFCFVLDHIISDGLSIGIMVSELQALYAQYVTGRAANLPPLPAQYLDYAEWQRRRLAGGALAEHLNYWKEQLRPLSSALQLPTDRQRPKIQTFNGARVLKKFPPELSQQLKALARAEGVTLYMVLLAAFKVLLHRYTNDELIAVGSAIANRNRPEVDRVIGFFANNIVMLGDLSGEPTVREMLTRVRDTALKAYAHQDMPFDVLVDAVSVHRELDHSPLFQVMFVLHTLLLDRVDLVGLTCKPVEIEIGTSRFDLAVDTFDLQEGLRVYFEYNTDLFTAETISRMMDHYRMVLEGFVADPGARIREISMLSDEERRQLTQEWNRTDVAYPHEQTVHGLVAAQVRLTPRSEAVRFEDQSLTYEQLEARANQLALRLKALGVQHEALVGVCIDRSLDMIVALLGVLKAGAAYVPLDPAFPKDRIDFMIKDAGLETIVTHSRLKSLVSDEARTVCLDTQRDEIAAESGAHVESPAGAGSLAYVIYTSGSTGRPKGVQLEHRSVVNFLTSMHREPGIRAGERVLSVTTLSFDIAGLEIFGPLTIGGTVVIADRATALDGQRLMELIESCDATLMQATPATWRLLLESGWAGKSDLKILCGGEALPRDLADRLLHSCEELWNMYGPTETTIWSTVARVTAEERSPHIGQPIANTKVYVLDRSGQPLPIGVPGELYIGGDGVARGYLGRPELTAERFLEDQFAARAGARMYRTGDLARWRADGVLECLGRVDQQVKIRGYRIEPGEIETLLALHPEVAQAAVVARPDPSGEQRLVGYMVATAGSTLEAAVLRRFLATELPEYMIPSAFVVLPELPLTPNGKIDRKALPAPENRMIATASYVSPQNETEAAIVAIWQEVLKIDRVGRHDNFFDLGGHSLLVVQVQTRLQKKFSRNIMLIELFQHPTVAALGTFLESGGSGAEEIELVRERAARQRALRSRSEAVN